MILPKRVKVDWRVKGGRKPDGVILCGRGTAFGNPFAVGSEVNGKAVETREQAQRYFRVYAQVKLQSTPDWLAPLRTATGIACPGCEPDDPHCHCAVLVSLISEGH